MENHYKKFNINKEYTEIGHLQILCMKELSGNAFKLYVMMKDYAKGNKEFEFPHRVYKELFSNQTFSTARDELIKKGFLQNFVSQAPRRQPNTYRFSGDWKNKFYEIIKTRPNIYYANKKAKNNIIPQKVISSTNKSLDFENQGKRFIKITHYMLQHESFKDLSSSAKVALLYMLDWAFGSNEFLETGAFEFSTTMLSNNNIMSRATAMTALKELENAKFIQKENNACAHSGITQKWSFSDRWHKDVSKLSERENDSIVKDYSANLYASMLLSNAWMSLSPKQKELYLYCKLQLDEGEKIRSELLTYEEQERNISVDISDRFTMNKSKWDKTYHLYNNNTQRYFYKDMKALIDKGFIDIVESNKNTRKKNIYKISDKWQNLGENKITYEKELKNYNVYLHILPNGKKYVGISKDVQKRWGKNGEGYSANKDFYKDIQTFGWENIEHIILKENLSKKEAMFYEYAYTAKYKSYDKSFGYNIFFLEYNEFIRRFCKKNEDKETLEKCIKEVEKE